jgi:hypothetical protein
MVSERGSSHEILYLKNYSSKMKKLRFSLININREIISSRIALQKILKGDFSCWNKYTLDNNSNLNEGIKGTG